MLDFLFGTVKTATILLWLQGQGVATSTPVIGGTYKTMEACEADARFFSAGLRVSTFCHEFHGE